MTVVYELLESTTARLSLLSNTPQLDAQVLLAHVFQKPRSWVLAHSELALAPGKALLIETLIKRSEHGEPLPYILGHWEFFGLDFELTPDVLIPRPETEVLVERAIDWLQASPDRRRVADIGSGSGCIAIALATNIPDVHILATDISLRALEVARGNAAKHKVADRVDFLDCDVFPVHPDPLPTEDHFDLICANLPYIPTEKLMALPIYGREPTVALDGGQDGLDVFRKLLGLAPEWLAPGGRILLEIEATLGRAALSLAYDAFSEAELHLHKDLAGQNRLLEIQLPLL
jgi:release factor glutamine methyltransferase